MQYNSIICRFQIEEKDVFSCLDAILVVMTTYMEQEQSVITANMIKCASVLHGKFKHFVHFLDAVDMGGTLV